jgi:hypothetical protein
LQEFNVADPRNPIDVWRGAGGQGVYIKSLAKNKDLFYVGTTDGMNILNLRLPDHAEIGRYRARFGEQFGEVVDMDIVDDRIYVVARVGDIASIRILQVRSHATTYLPFVAKQVSGSSLYENRHSSAKKVKGTSSDLLSTLLFQGPVENRFGIGEADKGAGINWTAQSHSWADAYDWKPDSGTSMRQVYTGPDVIGTWVFVHSPDTYSEGAVHFGSNFAGPVSNGASDPLSKGVDLFWVSNNRGDMAREMLIASAVYTDGNGHTYNRNHHGLLGPGGHHLHDINGDKYINCYDIQGFDPNNSIATCDAINKTGSNDGIWVQDLNTFLNFVAANPGKAWAIGGENVFYDTYDVDPFMFAIFLKDLANLIRSSGGAGTRVYLKDVANLWGILNCNHGNVCNDTMNEPGTSSIKDGGDWWYTVAQHFHNLGGQVDGFVADMGISASDDYYCWDALDGSLETRSWCESYTGTYVVPFDNSAPDYTETSNGQWLERRARPFTIDQDDQYRGAYAWNAFIRYLDQEVRAVLFWLVSEEYHTPIVRLFGMNTPGIDKNQPWGAGGKSLYWASPGVPSAEVCPANPWNRYNNVSTGNRAQNDGTNGVPANDITAGYVACNYRPTYNGWKVGYPSTFDFVIFQGTGLPIRAYREDSNGDGLVDSNATTLYSLIPDGSYGPGADGLHLGREDALMMAGLMQQLALKWNKITGFAGYNIKWWFGRAAHTMPDKNDGVLGDSNITFNTCSGQEYGLTDYDAGGYRTPVGEVFYRVVAQADYTWWPEGTNWQHSPSGPYCYAVGERYQQRPDQSHDRDGNGNHVDLGDFPSGW